MHIQRIDEKQLVEVERKRVGSPLWAVPNDGGVETTCLDKRLWDVACACEKAI